ncbi:MAG: hypothetical protein HY902_15555 [Deltaproteobacteria bacterium]|nr:hypothetical protein [Deltaproteobacteria bacterium]
MALAACGSAADGGDPNDNGGALDTPVGDGAADGQGPLWPQIAVTSPAAGTTVYPATTLDLTVQVQQVSAAAAWSLRLWDGSGTWSQNQVLQPGSSSLHFAVTVPEAPGPWQVQLAAHSTAAAADSPTLTLELQVDGRPSQPEIGLEPLAPTVLDAIAVKILKPASDPENQALQQAQQWHINGVAAAATGPVLPAGQAKKGQTVAVTLLVSDGHSSSLPATAQVQIGNAPPQPAVLAATGSAPLDLSSVAAVAVDQPASDPDGDPLTTTLQWQVDGETVSGAVASKHSLIELALLLKKPIVVGSLIQVRATSSDGLGTATSLPVSWQVGPAKLCPLLQPCGDHADCVESDSTEPKCFCQKGYVGDGHTCLKLGGPLADLAAGATLHLPAAGELPVSVGDSNVVQGKEILLSVVDLASGSTLATAQTTPPTGLASLVATVQPAGSHTLRVAVAAGGKPIWQQDYPATVNQPPKGLAELALSNPAPTTLDSVTASVVGGVTDPDAADGAALTWTFVWQKATGVPLLSGATLPAKVAKKGEMWQVHATPSDGLDIGVAAVASVTFVNAAPAKPVLAAKNPQVSLLGTAEVALAPQPAVDADGDPVEVTVQWQVNGSPVPGASGTSAVVANLAPWAKQGDVLTATATASDGALTSASGAVTIAVVGGDAVCASPLRPCAATALCTENLSLQPACACAPGSFGDGLVCASVDLSQTATHVVSVGQALPLVATLSVGKGYSDSPPQLWVLADPDDTRHASLQAGAQSVSFVETTPGWHLWNLTLRSGKGASLGQWPVPVYGNLPPGAPQIALKPAAPDTTQVIAVELAAPATDADVGAGQQITYKYQWSVGGQPAGTGPQLPALTAKKGQVVQVSVVASDGYASGPPVQAQLVVANAPPPAFAVVVPTKADLVGSIAAQLPGAATLDADGEAVVCQSTWQVGGIALVGGATATSLDLLKTKRADGKPLQVGDQLIVQVTCSDGLAPVTAVGGPVALQSPGIDVCAVFNPCDKNALCLNNDTLAPACQCAKGFAGDGASCSDIDECASNNGDCSPQAKCTNTVGSRVCACKPGWTGNGQTCSDIDECTAGTATCDTHADCSNTAGAYTCTCKPGWTGTGSSCTDIDECKAGTAQCDSHASCGNTAGSYACTCQPGWTGNGKTCSDVDECSLGSDNCSAYATCTNTAGSFTCKCLTGYTGDGVTCKAQAGSCAGKCGGAGSTGTCLCDTGCVAAGDCCPDYSLYCPSQQCGNGKCESGETPSNCWADCWNSPVCGNGKCESGETPSNCSADCASSHYCDTHCGGSGTGCYCDTYCKSYGDCCNAAGTGVAGSACMGSTCADCK